jgi:hypothetical protein
MLLYGEKYIVSVAIPQATNTARIRTKMAVCEQYLEEQ